MQSILWVLANSTQSPPDTKKLQEVTLFVAKNDRSVLLSCTTTLVLGLIQPRTRLYYLSPTASLNTRTVDHPQKTRCQAAVHSATTDSAVPPWKKTVPKQEVPRLITSKEQILKYYPYVFDVICKFPGPPYHIQLDPGVPLKQAPCCPIPVHPQEAFQQEVNKMLQVGVLQLVQEATSWINSFVLVEGKDKSGNLKLRICLDPTNLNKATVREPYHFKTPEDIAYLIADACIMTLCDCKKDTGINCLMKLHHICKILMQNLIDSVHCHAIWSNCCRG